MTPKPVPTNGIGKRTTAHLNRTITLADVWRLVPKPGAIVATEPPKRTAAQQAVADGYAAGTPTRVIAALAGIQPYSVKTLACRMGIKRPRKASRPVAPRRPPFAGYDRTEKQWG